MRGRNAGYGAASYVQPYRGPSFGRMHNTRHLSGAERRRAEQDDIDAIGLNVLLPKGNQRRSTEIHGKPDAGSVNQYTRLEPAPAAKGIT
jgi:hypothetical protein